MIPIQASWEYPPHPPSDVDSDSDYPVPVDPPHGSTQSLLPHGVDHNATRPIEHQGAPPVEGSLATEDLPDEVAKLDSTRSAGQLPQPELSTFPLCFTPAYSFSGPFRGFLPSERTPSPDWPPVLPHPPSRVSTISNAPSSPNPSTFIVPPPTASRGSSAVSIANGGVSSRLRTPAGNSTSHSSSSAPPPNITIRDSIRRSVTSQDAPDEAYVSLPRWPLIDFPPHRDSIGRAPSASGSHHSFSPLRPIGDTGFEFYVPSRSRDEEIWFEDGNVVLQASNIEFRVYKGPLMALSPVLHSLCQKAPTAPYPGAVKLTYIDLWDTTPDDLRHVLRFVYGGTSRVEPSFYEIAAHIRFGRQYKAKKLLQRSLDYLKKFYVAELSAWLRLPALDPPFFEPMHAIGVVKLARLLGKDGETLLPIALMRCCTLGAQLVDEYPFADRLSPADLGRCFEGRVKLLEASVRAAETLRTHMTSDECSHPRRCKAALQRFVDELLGPEDSTSGDGVGIRLANALRCLRWDLYFSQSSRSVFLQDAGAAVGADEERELCFRCFVRQLEEQRKIFARLPQMMGVSVQGWAVQDSAAA